MKTTANKRQWILSLCLVPLLVLTVWCGWQVYENSTRRADIKDDFSEVNSIVYGLFSVDRWRNEVESIILSQIEDFDLTPKQDSLLSVQVSQMLYTMIDEAKATVQQNDESFKKKLRKWAVNAMVDWDELRQQVPHFTDVIISELTKEESKERLKALAQDKLREYAQQTFDDSDSLLLNKIYHRYGTHNQRDFNEVTHKRAAELQKETYNYTYIMLGVVLLFLAIWAIAWKRPQLWKPLFMLSVALALIILLTGLASPMIEIDARIKKVDFTLLGRHIEFFDQMIFYRSKSILEVVGLLMQSSRIDSILVGVLVLAFSVLLPVSKLISTGIYLLTQKAKVRKNGLLKWLAFQSGKWSMADVMVVAIFMAFVSFDGILDEQLKQAEMNTQQVTSISTNLTSLQPGFILFFAYVLYALLLAVFLKKVTKKDREKED